LLEKKKIASYDCFLWPRGSTVTTTATAVVVAAIVVEHEWNQLTTQAYIRSQVTQQQWKSKARKMKAESKREGERKNSSHLD
jgi:hypothetical protein